jgi:hypothetical protein
LNVKRIIPAGNNGSLWVEANGRMRRYHRQQWVAESEGWRRELAALPALRFVRGDPKGGLWAAASPASNLGLIQPNCGRGRDGTLWFGMENSVAGVHPDRGRINARSPTVVLEEIRVNEKPVWPARVAAVRYAAALTAQPAALQGHWQQGNCPATLREPGHRKVPSQTHLRKAPRSLAHRGGGSLCGLARYPRRPALTAAGEARAHSSGQAWTTPWGRVGARVNAAATETAGHPTK